MFLLTKNDGTIYCLPKDCHFKIGRQTGQVILNDITVSRVHAEIWIKNKSVFIKDLKSSGGTYINSNKISPEKEFKVLPESNVQFGTKDSKFVLQVETVVVTQTSLNSSEKELFKQLMKKMDYQIMQHWDYRCTHVVVNKFSLTRKVLCALIMGQYIVNLDYFDARFKCISKGQPLPKEVDYQTKEMLHSNCARVPIDYTINRRNMFRYKVFAFATEAPMKRMEQIIKLAGGDTLNMEETALTEGQIRGKDVEYILVMDENHSQSSNRAFERALKQMEKLSRRAISIQEIAYSVLFGRTDFDCNSYYDKVKAIMSGTTFAETGSTLALETQTQTQAKNTKSLNTMVIPDTCDFANKRKTSDCDEEKDKELKKRKVAGSLQNTEVLEEIIDVPDLDSDPVTNTSIIREESQKENLESRSVISAAFEKSKIEISEKNLKTYERKSELANDNYEKGSESKAVLSKRTIEETESGNSLKPKSKKLNIKSLLGSKNKQKEESKKEPLVDFFANFLKPASANKQNSSSDEDTDVLPSRKETSSSSIVTPKKIASNESKTTKDNESPGKKKPVKSLLSKSMKRLKDCDETDNVHISKVPKVEREKTKFENPLAMLSDKPSTSKKRKGTLLNLDRITKANRSIKDKKALATDEKSTEKQKLWAENVLNIEATPVEEESEWIDFKELSGNERKIHHDSIFVVIDEPYEMPLKLNSEKAKPLANKTKGFVKPQFEIPKLVPIVWKL